MTRLEGENRLIRLFGMGRILLLRKPLPSARERGPRTIRSISQEAGMRGPVQPQADQKVGLFPQGSLPVSVEFAHKHTHLPQRQIVLLLLPDADVSAQGSRARENFKATPRHSSRKVFPTTHRYVE